MIKIMNEISIFWSDLQYLKISVENKMLVLIICGLIFFIKIQIMNKNGHNCNSFLKKPILNLSSFN